MTVDPRPRFGLVDVNNFYCSCEAVFDPRLVNQPLVVLSNNDGCAVARSASAKLRGIKMGEPWHLVRNTEKGRGVIAMSSNYTLYGSMSDRVMTILRDMAPSIEVYSIDEAFMHVQGIPELTRFGRDVRERIRQWTGLPVCVGYGTSKTRAKLSNHVAKKRPQYNGVFDIEALAESAQDELLGSIEVGEVWGVGRRLAPKLRALGIQTVRDLRDANTHRIRSQFSVVLQKTIEELRGVSCLPLELAPPAQQQIMCSRSFGREVNSQYELREAALAYVSRAAERLRKQQLLAGGLIVFAQTNPFASRPQYSRSITIPLPVATDDTRTLANYAAAAIAKIYRPGFRYKKVGTMLTELRPRSARQASLLASVADQERRSQLNVAMDTLNARFGKETITVGGVRLGRGWTMHQQNLSPAYTTRWEDLPLANAREHPPLDTRH